MTDPDTSISLYFIKLSITDNFEIQTGLLENRFSKTKMFDKAYKDLFVFVSSPL